MNADPRTNLNVDELAAAIDAAELAVKGKVERRQCMQEELKAILERVAAMTVNRNIEKIAQSIAEHGWDKSITHFTTGVGTDLVRMTDLLRMLDYYDVKPSPQLTVYLPFVHTDIKWIKCVLCDWNQIRITFAHEK